MEDIDSAIALKEKLLIAGIDEISKNGITGLSLRKVAASCGASCAAPYKHFKNKDDFIEQIIKYVDDKWLLLGKQIIENFSDSSERIAQLCTANVKFNISNPLYNMALPQNKLIAYEVTKHCKERNFSDSDIKGKLFAIRVLTGGTAALIEKGSLENCPETFTLLHDKIISELSAE